MSHTHSGYGFFPGGDPRRFTPDGDASSPEENSAHKAACDAANEAEKRGYVAQVGASCVHAPGIVLTRSRFGLGVYTYDCDELGCDEADDAEPDDPNDANASLAKYLSWDFDVNLPDGVADSATLAQCKEIAAAAFIAGFRVRESDPPVARIEGEARS